MKIFKIGWSFIDLEDFRIGVGEEMIGEDMLGCKDFGTGCEDVGTIKGS